MESFDQYLPIIIAVAAFAVTLMLYWSGARYFKERNRRKNIVSQIQSTAQPVSSPFATEPSEDVVEITGRPLNPLAKALSYIGLRVSKDRSLDYSRSRLKFLKAGLRGEHLPAVFLGSKFVLGCSFLFAFIFSRALLFTAIPTQVTILLTCCVGLAGFYLPNLWLIIRIDQRKKIMLNSFPDALDMMVVCVEAGLGLDAAILRVAKEIEFAAKELSTELKLINMEINAGKQRREALQNFAQRTDLQDVSNLVSLLIQADRFGTSVAKTLRVYSDALRTKRFSRAEERAAKIAVKLIFPLILFILPTVFMVLVGPAIMRIGDIFVVK